MREISSDHDVEHGGDDHDGEDDEDNDDNRWHCHPSHDPCLREAPSSDAISVSPILVTTSPILPSHHIRALRISSTFTQEVGIKYSVAFVLKNRLQTGQIKRLINVILIAGNLLNFGCKGFPTK